MVLGLLLIGVSTGVGVAWVIYKFLFHHEIVLCFGVGLGLSLFSLLMD